MTTDLIIHRLNKKQLKVVGKMDSFIYTYKNNTKRNPERIVLFREDYSVLADGEKFTYKGIEVVSK